MTVAYPYRGQTRLWPEKHFSDHPVSRGIGKITAIVFDVEKYRRAGI